MNASKSREGDDLGRTHQQVGASTKKLGKGSDNSISMNSAYAEFIDTEVRWFHRPFIGSLKFGFLWQWGLCALVLLLIAHDSMAQAVPISGGLPIRFNVGVEGGKSPQDVDVAVKVLFGITILTLAPSIILLMTSFTRIVIVLSFVRSALSLQGTPANQIIVGLSLFITYFIMEPVWGQINSTALQPYMASTITSEQAMDAAARPIRTFMLKQTRPKDLELFVSLAKLPAGAPDQLPLKVVIPGFITSELRTAFQMGFLLFVPFILIDLIVAAVLMSMGMMMMPPATVALPLKILLFVLVDGWSLVVRSLILSFAS